MFLNIFYRFAQLFIEPLFTTSAIEREIRAVNSEHQKNVADDFWRLIQLERNAADPNHSFNYFKTGNYISLVIYLNA